MSHGKVCKSLNMDFQNLISCIKCHDGENVDIILETLKTIVNICAEEVGKDAFRDVGGLDFILDFLTNTTEISILEYALKVLAFVIDGNVHNQLHMTNIKVFKVLQAVFEKKTYPDGVLKNAVLLFSTILYQNRAAQDLISEDKCIQSLMNYYRWKLPVSVINSPIEDEACLEIWFNINSALCFAVNNPRNEQNQKLCSELFPLALKVIEVSSCPSVIEAAASFLSLCIAENDNNQKVFADNEGFIVLKCSLSQNFDKIQSCMKECNNIISKKTIQILNSLIGVISSAVSDNEKNASLCGKLGIISLMIKALSLEILDKCLQKKIILTLGHCIGAYSNNRFIVLDVPDFDVLLKKNLDIDDEELHFATKYLLEVCLSQGSSESEFDDECCSVAKMDKQTYSPVNKRLEMDEDFCSQLKNSKFSLDNTNKNSYPEEKFQILKEHMHGSLNLPSEEQMNHFHKENLQQASANKTKTLSHNKCNPDSLCSVKEMDHNLLFDFDNCLNSKKRKSMSTCSSEFSLQSAGQLHQQKLMKEFGKKLSKKAHLKSSIFDPGSKVSKIKNKNSEICGNKNGFSKINTLNSFQNVFEKQDLGNKSKTDNKSTSSRIKSSRAKNNIKRNSKYKNEMQTPNLKNLNNSSAVNLEIPEIDTLSLENSFKSKKSVLKDISNNAFKRTDKISSSKLFLKSMDNNKCMRNCSHQNCSHHAVRENLNYEDKSRMRRKISCKSSTCEDKSTCTENQSIAIRTFNKSHRKMMKGCVQVTVLPGPICVEHKLAAQFEMLKVCLLSDVQNS